MTAVASDRSLRDFWPDDAFTDYEEGGDDDER